MSAVTITITSQGKEMDSTYGVLSVEVNKELNRVPTAQIKLADGDPAARKFKISDSSFFEPGKEIEIKLGYVGKPSSTIFKGVVARHGIEAEKSSSKLVIELRDKAGKLTFGRKSAVFRDQTDSDAIKKLLSDAGVSAGEIASTKPKHPELVQFNASDWDFMLSRADILGLVVAVDDGEVSLKEMKVSGGHKHEFKYGTSDVYSITADIDAVDQRSQIESVGWDLKQLRTTQPSKAKAASLPQGTVDGSSVAQKIGGTTSTLTSVVPLETEELQAWADARMAKSRLSMIRGKITVPGLGGIKPLDVIKLSNVGDRFDGKSLATGVVHTVEGGVWKTEVQFGLSREPFSHQEHIADAPAAGLLPPVSGLQIGVVDEFKDDPDSEYRLRVILPSIDDQEGAVWARLAAPEAGKDRGYFFRPEPGDEVVVGFFNSDPRQPVVLGGMFGSKNKPHEFVKQIEKKNKRKAIITKKGTMIGFVDEDDNKASVFIETKNKNKVLLDDDNKCIKITDQHNNSITMDKDGVVIESAKDFKIRAKGRLDMNASKDIKVSSDSTVTVTGPKVDIK